MNAQARIHRTHAVRSRIASSIRLALALVLVLGVAFAQRETMTLERALEHAAARPAAVDAASEAADARAALERTLADPLALRPERLQAEGRAAVAEGRAVEALLDARLEIARAYTQAAAAERQARLAGRSRDVAASALEIARIRFERGGATQLELRDAQTSLDEAEAGVAAAESGAQLALRNLEGLLGVPVGSVAPAEIDGVPVPPLDALLSLLENHPIVREIDDGVALAEVQVELLDPSYAPRVQIESAQLQLEGAERMAREVRRGLALQIQSLHDAVRNSERDLLVQEDALETARSRLAFDEQRLEAGLIAEINVRQSELAALQAELAHVAARHAYLVALLELQAGVASPLEGLDAALR